MMKKLDLVVAPLLTGCAVEVEPDSEPETVRTTASALIPPEEEEPAPAETTFPTLDGASKEAAYLKIKVTPKPPPEE